MTSSWKNVLWALLLLFALAPARAAINCTTVTSPGVNMQFASGTANAQQSTFTVSCTRGLASDPQSQSYVVTVDNGLYVNAAPQNRARFNFIVSFYVNYDTYSTAACNAAVAWQGTTGITDTITWAAGQTGTLTKQTTFWVCVPSQTSLGITYTDTVTMTLTQNGTVRDTGTFPVSITSPASCSFSTPPTGVTLNYAAFGPQQIATGTFAVRCNAGVAYTLALDPLGDVLNGVRYTAAMSGASGTGNGNAQNYTITVTAPAGQAGQCLSGSSCTATRLHTVTITY